MSQDQYSNGARKWNSGPPPSVGWWPASACRGGDVFRWWNGIFWSWPAYRDMSACEASKQARKEDENTRIEWQHRPESWSERSKT